MNPNMSTMLLLMAVMGGRDDDRLLQTLVLTSLLGGNSLTPTPTGTAPAAPANQSDMLLMFMAFGCNGGLFSKHRDRDHDRDHQTPPSGSGRKAT